MQGWLVKFVQFRVKHPFVFSDELIAHLNQAAADPDSAVEVMDDVLCQTLRERGILFGYPVLVEDDEDVVAAVQYLSAQDKGRFIYVDTLFKCMVQECAFFYPTVGLYEFYLCQVLTRFLQFFLNAEVHPFANKPLDELLQDPRYLEQLAALEVSFDQQTKVDISFSFASGLRNSFAFFDIFTVVSWNRSCQDNPSNVHKMMTFREQKKRLQEQVFFVMVAMMWANNQTSSGWLKWRRQLRMKPFPKPERRLLSVYCHTADIPKKVCRQLLRKPLGIAELSLSVNCAIVSRYLLEQTILMQLLCNKPGLSESMYVLADSLQLTRSQLHASLSSVTTFFDQYHEEFSFLTGKAVFSHLKSYSTDSVNNIVRKNMSAIMREIKNTNELYETLLRASHQPLSKQESQFVRKQLLSIAKTVPALAIFCLPAGAIVLAAMTKLLPFSILPDAFVEQDT